MENRKLIKIFIPALALGFFFFTQGAFAYGVPTHALLTKEVVDFYNAHAADNKIPDELKNYLVDGARREDDLPRWLNHFYDPVHGNGLKSVVYGGGYASKAWAEDKTKQNDLKYKATTFLASILTAIQERNVRALTAETDFTWERGIRFYANGEKEKGLFILGHVLHLVEDASVPDHTRNDPHPGWGEDYSPYENYAKKYDLDNPDKDLPSRLSSKTALDFATLGGYFESLANYSNNNFYSKDTIGIQSGFDSPTPDYEEKLGNYLFGIKKDSESRDYKLFLKQGKTILGQLVSNSNDFVLLLNKDGGDVVMSDYWSRLSTKAVLHGAGVIKLFFEEVEKAKNDSARLKEEKSAVGQAIEALRKTGSSIGAVFGRMALTGPGGEVLGEFPLDEEDDEEQTPAASSSATKSSSSTSAKTTTSSTAPKNTSPLANPQTQGDVLGASDEPADTSVQECAFDGGGTPSRSPVVINEVAWMGGQNSANDEWVELKNISTDSTDVSGWQVRDKDGQIKAIIPGGTKILSGGFYLLERGEDATSISSDQTYTGGLKNDNEALRLFGAGCALIDEVFAAPKWPAGDNTTKQTMERDATGFGWHTSANSGGTPRAQNSAGVPAPATSGSSGGESADTPPPPPLVASSGSAADHVVISEIMAGSDASSSDEFIELYNSTDTAVDITGWELRKRTSSGSESNLVDNAAFVGQIPAKGFFLIASPSYQGSRTPDISYSVTSGNIAYSSNTIVLYAGDNASAAVVDEVAYESADKNKSLERRAFEGGACVAASGGSEFLGNACDSGSAADFDLRELPNPQNAASLPEPRSAPAAVRGFDGAFSSDSAELIFNWDPSSDATGDEASLVYEIKDLDGGAVLYRGPETAAEIRVTEVGRTYRVAVTAIDRDGLASMPAETEIEASSYLDNLYFYKSTDNSAYGGKNILELRYGDYPFLPSVYREGGGGFYHYVFFYLNGIPALANILNSGNNLRPSDDVDSLVVYYPTCGGSNADTPHGLLSLEDDISNPANCVGGFLADRLSFGQIQSRTLTVPVGLDGSFGPDDYVTAVFYGRYTPNPGESLKLVAVDKNRYGFWSEQPEHAAPALDSEPDFEFRKTEGKLIVTWEAASDEDTDDDFITYDINISPASDPDSGGWTNIGASRSYELFVFPGGFFNIWNVPSPVFFF